MTRILRRESHVVHIGTDIWRPLYIGSFECGNRVEEESRVGTKRFGCIFNIMEIIKSRFLYPLKLK